MKIEDLAKTFERASDNVVKVKSELVKAESDLELASLKLAKVISPNDMQPGEKIAVWVRLSQYSERLVVVTEKGGTLSTSFRGVPRDCKNKFSK